MSGTWRTDEPEVGVIAWLVDEDGTDYLAEFTKYGWWISGNDFLAHDCVEKWKPINTPEERRLRDEVERLNFDMGRLGDVLKEAGELIDSIGDGSTCSMVNRIRDVLADTGLGGA